MKLGASLATSRWRLPKTANPHTETANHDIGGLGGLEEGKTANAANSESGGLHND
jgi:hypothetical protein